ncbi:hypothetical protein ZWY2020_009109 [Hordeum vulgare]|nr:hypothetical protein ZWY2020_009109 [Hordeum vulgare]
MAAAAAKIASSMLSSNFANLASEVECMVCLGVDSLHMDVMAVIKSFCNGDPAAVQNIFGWFLLHVYPGETLVTEMWVDGQRVQYQTKVKEHDCAVLSGYVVLKQHISSSL